MRASDRIAEGTVIDALEHWAERTPAASALSEGGTAFDYLGLRDAVRATAGALRDRRGIGAGDPVVLAGDNSWQWVVAYLALLSLGAVAVPANTRLSAEQFAAQAAFAEAVLVLVDEQHAHFAAGVAAPVERLEHPELILAGAVPAGREPSAPPLLDATAQISFTSGTTGTPKGAVLSHRALAEGARTFARVLGTDSGDSTLVMVPMFHNTGFVDQLGHMLVVGGHTILLRRFKTRLAVEELAARQVSYLTAVPSIIRLVMTHDRADEAFGRARIVLYGGSPMPESWSAELARRWPSLRLFHGYGLTEFTSAVSFLPPELAAGRGESVGVPAPGVELRLLGEPGDEVADGEVGEIVVRGATRMSEYWRAPKLTAERIRDGWLRTGDLGHREDGLLFLDGRSDDVINRGGEKVLPAFVESQLCELDGVAEASVFPLPDPVLQQRVHAVVRLRPGDAAFDAGAALHELRRRLPDYAVPETLRVWDDLPRGASGKVDRRAVVRIRQTEEQKEEETARAE